jgi:hypothetical protein
MRRRHECGSLGVRPRAFFGIAVSGFSAALLLAACGGGEPAGSGGSGAQSTSGGGSSGASTSTSTTGNGGTGVILGPEDPGVPELPEDCEASAPGEPMLRRLTQQELLNSEAAVFADAAAQVTAELPPDLQGAVRLSNDSATLLMGSQLAEAVLARAEQIADVVTSEQNLTANLPCAAQADAACAGQFIEQYGSALFRRPLSDDDRARYVAHFESVSQRSDFATGLKWVLVSLIQSPHAVYRSELGADGQLTQYEIASQLAYDYSASPPSAELLALAEAGDLADAEERVAEATRLLESPAGHAVIRQFFSEWLWLSQIGSVNRTNVPDNFATIKSKMQLETERFVDEVLFTNRGTLADLLTANYTVADSDLSAYYGFSGGTGDLLSGGGVQVPRTQGVGIFAQGSVLTTMASVQITSPTRRGLLLLKRLYCEVPGAPEAVSFDLTRSDVVGNTTRERLENSHLSNGVCKGCHAAFDPLGFAFEHFDHIGRYRTEEQTDSGAFPIDASVEVEKLDGQLVNGQEELMTALAEDREVLSCISSTLERYVYGGDGSCRAKDARSRVMAGEASVVDYLAQLAREPHFVSRQ